MSVGNWMAHFQGVMGWFLSASPDTVLPRGIGGNLRTNLTQKKKKRAGLVCSLSADVLSIHSSAHYLFINSSIQPMSMIYTEYPPTSFPLYGCACVCTHTHHTHPHTHTTHVRTHTTHTHTTCVHTHTHTHTTSSGCFDYRL